MPPALTASDLAGLRVVAGAGRGGRMSRPRGDGEGRQAPVPRAPRTALCARMDL